MKIKLIVIGKTDEKYLQEGISKYLDRLKHYVSFDIVIINDVKVGSKQNVATQKEQEGKLLLNNIGANEYVVLLDENGKNPNSVDFSQFIQKRLNAATDVVFVIGGPFGFSSTVYDRANDKISLSKMTFSHQMIRLFFVEQLYRSFTILKGEKYHHQ